MRRVISPRVLILALPLVLGGCAGVVAAGSAIGAAGGSLALANEAAQLVGTTLSDSAKLACAIQAAANANGDSRLSTEVGPFCKW